MVEVSFNLKTNLQGILLNQITKSLQTGKTTKSDFIILK